MPDDHPLPQQAILHAAGTHLTEHLPDGLRGHGEVVRGVGIAPGRLLQPVFQVRQPDLHFSFQQTQRLHPLVAAAVEHHRHRQRLLQRRQQEGDEVAGGDEVDVVGALSDKLTEDLPQPLRGDGLAHPLGGDGVVLAVDAAQRAAGEEHRSAAPCTGEHRLLPQVQPGPCDDRHGGHPAEAAAVGLGALRPAPTGPDVTDHTRLMSKSGPRSPAIQWRRQRPMYLSLAPSTT